MTTLASEKKDFNDTWTLWFHSLETTDWSINGYEKIQTIKSISDFWIVMNNIDINIGMYYLMRNNTVPIWDHPDNIGGYNYTFKCYINDTYKIFINMCCLVLGETISLDNDNVVGISTSPKSKNNIIRLWSKKELTERNTVKSDNFNIVDWKVVINK